MKKSTFCLVALAGLLIFAGEAQAKSGPSNSQVSLLPPQQPHAPIVLNHDPIPILGYEKYQQNGIRTGTGQEADPWIVSGWNISSKPEQAGVQIQGVKGYLEIRNVTVRLPFSNYIESGSAFIVSDSPHVVISDVVVISGDRGMSIGNSTARLNRVKITADASGLTVGRSNVDVHDLAIQGGSGLGSEDFGAGLWIMGSVVRGDRIAIKDSIFGIEITGHSKVYLSEILVEPKQSQCTDSQFIRCSSLPAYGIYVKDLADGSAVELDGLSILVGHREFRDRWTPVTCLEIRPMSEGPILHFVHSVFRNCYEAVHIEGYTQVTSIFDIFEFAAGDGGVDCEGCQITLMDGQINGTRDRGFGTPITAGRSGFVTALRTTFFDNDRLGYATEPSVIEIQDSWWDDASTVGRVHLGPKNETLRPPGIHTTGFLPMVLPLAILVGAVWIRKRSS